MEEFNWDSFKKGKLIVSCANKEEYQNFNSALDKNKIEITYNIHWDSQSVYYYTYDEYACRVYQSKINNDVNIVKWGNYMNIETEMKKEFTKADLKDWMIAETREGRKYVVDLRHNQLINLMINSSWTSLYDYMDNLKCRSEFDRVFDIVKIYECSNTSKCIRDSIAKNDLKLIWERKEPKRMTKSEIEKELGYEIEIID